jgi:hypothetical protein
VGQLAATSGFSSHGRHRAVLAVHEAAALACRLVADAAGPASGPLPGEGCVVRLHAEPGLLVAEIDLPPTTTFPAASRDHDPLRYVRAFAPDAGWAGALRARRLRVAARNDR